MKGSGGAKRRIGGTMRIGAAFERARSEGRVALITYLMAGDPDPAASVEAFLALDRSGADIIEVGVPFSDPIADGPVIQAAGERALATGMTLRGAIDLVRELRRRGFTAEKPILVMTYLNPVLAMGVGKFTHSAAEAGIDGVIIPDLPPEEALRLDITGSARSSDPALTDPALTDPALTDPALTDLALVFLAAPTTRADRMEKIKRYSTGFIYYVSLEGVTGMRDELREDITERVAAIRTGSSIPVAVGFGISSPGHVRAVSPVADGVVVGSALVRSLSEGGPGAVGDLTALLSAATRRRP